MTSVAEMSVMMEIMIMKPLLLLIIDDNGCGVGCVCRC